MGQLIDGHTAMPPKVKILHLLIAIMYAAQALLTLFNLNGPFTGFILLAICHAYLQLALID